MKAFWPVLGSVVVAAIAASWWWQLDDAVPTPMQAGAVHTPATHALETATRAKATQWPFAAPEGDGLQRVALPPVDTHVSATAALAQARINGDPRTPPIASERTPDILATAADKADAKSYARFEQGQHERMLASFVDAANTNLPKMRADIERARAMGIPEDQIAVGLEKVRLIEQMSQSIQTQHPEWAAQGKPAR